MDFVAGCFKSFTAEKDFKLEKALNVAIFE
jgi:hypothetical protein